jgi:hypothetical protein
MGKGIRAQRRERRGSMFHCVPSSPHDAKDPLLPLELRFDALDAASSAVHSSKSIPQRVAACGGFRRESGSIEKSD